MIGLVDVVAVEGVGELVFDRLDDLRPDREGVRRLLELRRVNRLFRDSLGSHGVWGRLAQAFFPDGHGT
eukprot:scaffold300525_cov11-Prasinocladus_malaysianus.AAC.1